MEWLKVWARLLGFKYWFLCLEAVFDTEQFPSFYHTSASLSVEMIVVPIS